MSRVGILTPMANPTVEAEMRRLLGVNFVVARLVSGSDSPTQRLIDYAEQADEAVRQFGGMALDAIGFACTASSYLIGKAREGEIAASFSTAFLFATAAVEARLGTARHIAVISPYPPDLHDAGLAYWHEAGFEISFDARVEIGSSDTRAIYALDGSEAASVIAQARAHRPDAILLSGTGMPTLALIAPDGDPPVLSSNYCLAEALMAEMRRG